MFPVRTAPPIYIIDSSMAGAGLLPVGMVPYPASVGFVASRTTLFPAKGKCLSRDGAQTSIPRRTPLTTSGHLPLHLRKGYPGGYLFGLTLCFSTGTRGSNNSFCSSVSADTCKLGAHIHCLHFYVGETIVTAGSLRYSPLVFHRGNTLWSRVCL